MVSRGVFDKMHILIKKARKKDLNNLFKLYLLLEKYYLSKPSIEEKKWKKRTLSFIKDPKKGGIFISHDSGIIKGYISYYFIKGKEKQLENCLFINELYFVVK